MPWNAEVEKATYFHCISILVGEERGKAAQQVFMHLQQLQDQVSNKVNRAGLAWPEWSTRMSGKGHGEKLWSNGSVWPSSLCFIPLKPLFIQRMWAPCECISLFHNINQVLLIQGRCQSSLPAALPNITAYSNLISVNGRISKLSKLYAKHMNKSVIELSRGFFKCR